MKTLFFAAAAVVLSFSLTSSAEAKGPVSGGKSVGSHGSHGGQFQSRGGFHGQFRGHHSYNHNYRGWSQRRWFGNYGCYGHYCPTRSCWYYLYQPANCYLPITCAPTYAPISVPNAPPVTPNLAPNQAPVMPVKPVKPV